MQLSEDFSKVWLLLQLFVSVISEKNSNERKRSESFMLILSVNLF